LSQDPGRSVCWRYGKAQKSAKFDRAKLTKGKSRSKLVGLPRRGMVGFAWVCVRFLRTQQCAKSQCIYMYKTPVAGLVFRGWFRTVIVMDFSVAG